MGKREARKKRQKKPRAPAHLSVSPPKHRKRYSAVGGAILLMVITGAWYVHRAGYPTLLRLRMTPPENLLLITLDTTRADHLSCYGYSQQTTPNIDRLAETGVLFEQAHSTAPLTLPAHSTILTGLYPFNHGVRNNGDFYLPPDIPTLAGILRKRGYGTAAFISSFILDSRYGLAHDFDLYEDHLEKKEQALQDFEVERKGSDTTHLALSWLSSHAAKPFFLWLHLYDPHESYDPPEPFRSRFASLYDGEIAFADSLVGDMIARLDELGIRRKTLIVIVGDHGESLGEHHEESHSVFIYTATMRVPLVLNAPGAIPAGVRAAAPVSIADIFSTVVDILKLTPPSTQDGRSLVPLIAGSTPSTERSIYFESLFPKLYLHWAPLRGIRSGPWTYIEAPRAELYRVDSDPGETVNLLASNPDVVSRMRQRLTSIVPAGAPDRYSRQALDDETVSKLAELGYIAAAAYSGAEVASGNLPDPKDKIDFFNTLRDAQKEIRLDQFDRAIPTLEQVIAREPDNAVALLFLANGYLGQKDYPRAIETYRRYLSVMPASAYAHHWIAIASVRNGDRETALREENAALAIDSRYVDSYVMKAGLLASDGQYPQAAQALQEALVIDPDNTGIMNDLGAIYLEWKQLPEAAGIFANILKIDSNYAPAWTSLGIIAAAQNDNDTAVGNLRKALTISPMLREARFNLAKALISLKRYDEARRELTILLSQTEKPADDRVAAIRQATVEALETLPRLQKQ